MIYNSDPIPGLVSFWSGVCVGMGLLALTLHHHDGSPLKYQVSANLAALGSLSTFRWLLQILYFYTMDDGCSNMVWVQKINCQLNLQSFVSPVLYFFSFWKLLWCSRRCIQLIFWLVSLWFLGHHVLYMPLIYTSIFSPHHSVRDFEGQKRGGALHPPPPDEQFCWMNQPAHMHLGQQSWTYLNKREVKDKMTESDGNWRGGENFTVLVRSQGQESRARWDAPGGG